MASSKRSRTRSTNSYGPLRPPAAAHDAAAQAAATLAETLDALIERETRLGELIDAADPDDLPTLIKLFSLHAQIASRIGRLLRDQRALGGQAADGIAGAIAQALDELSNELGIPL